MLARNIHDEDTIELPLSATELELLNQAAAEAENAEREAARPVPQGCAASTDAPPRSEIEVAGAPAARVAAEILPVREVRTAAATGLTSVVPAAAAVAGRTLVVPTAAVAGPTLQVPALAASGTTLVVPAPDAFPERAARVAPRPATVEPILTRTTERVRGTLQFVPIGSAPAPLPRPQRRALTLETFGLRALARRTFGLRAAAAVIVAALIGIALWPKTPVPAPVATPTTAPTPVVAPSLFEPPLEGSPPTAATAAPTALAPAAAIGAPPSPSQPMRFLNPFDPSEVFEFPAGTSYVEARDQVAQILITRARTRNGLHDASATSTTGAPSPSPARNKASFAQQL